MHLDEIKVKINCDNGLCKNMAKYTVAKSGTPRQYQMNLCEECILRLSSAIQEIQQLRNKKTEG